MKCGAITVSELENNDVVIDFDIQSEIYIHNVFESEVMMDAGIFGKYIDIELDTHSVIISTPTGAITAHPDSISYPVDSFKIAVRKKFTKNCPPDYLISEVHSAQTTEFVTYVNGPHMDED